MHKLMILIEPQVDWHEFERDWPRFLVLAEKMPGLVKETTSKIQSCLHGSLPVAEVHEFFFESPEAAKQAMASPEGVAAGKMLQEITKGRVTLLFADHFEVDPENLRTTQKENDDDQS